MRGAGGSWRRRPRTRFGSGAPSSTARASRRTTRSDSTSACRATARHPSLTSDSLFTPLFVPDAVEAACSDRAWLAALLRFEAALAAAEAAAGVIPSDAADAIAAACEPDRFDAGLLGRQARAAGNPAAPLASALAEAVEGDAAGYVHWGATSQDAM